ncbi:MAG: hypothetical protein E6J90_21715 [Deltaproteobacteria bacterium]|nr:MAG: hypothetical protein E6J90_21715 [Deltaproteobacteria bacterium]
MAERDDFIEEMSDPGVTNDGAEEPLGPRRLFGAVGAKRAREGNAGVVVARIVVGRRGSDRHGLVDEHPGGARGAERCAQERG